METILLIIICVLLVIAIILLIVFRSKAGNELPLLQNKVAELQGVKVLNINDLANALKPVVMPGEQMQVKLLKEGKEPDQAVAYLDDGTMVVVDNGRRLLGKTLNVSITSVLQTQAGRMIFAKAEENAHEIREPADNRDFDYDNRPRDNRRNHNRNSGGNEGYPKR